MQYLKYSDCNGLGIPMYNRFKSMRDALNNTGKPIYYSLAKGDQTEISSPIEMLANSWRTSVKVRDNNWDNVRASFILNNNYAGLSQPGLINDPDLLAIGLGWLNPTEEKTHFAMWALAKAPLLISANLSSIN